MIEILKYQSIKIIQYYIIKMHFMARRSAVRAFSYERRVYALTGVTSSRMDDHPGFLVTIFHTC